MYVYMCMDWLKGSNCLFIILFSFPFPSSLSSFFSFSWPLCIVDGIDVGEDRNCLDVAHMPYKLKRFFMFYRCTDCTN